ncbi:MAG: hypothetical protein GY859_06630, partial [Desulfobacterales bacterium]|nr:hypothetical protein [Desulfobacterales bacterium]
MLLIVSRPSDISYFRFIDPRNSIPPILDALDSLPSHIAEVSFCDPPTLARLEKTISGARKAKRPYHILHFDGHWTYLPKIRVDALAFEPENAKTHLGSGAEPGDPLSRLDARLAMLEACRGSDLSDRPVFGSVAPALLKAGVSSVAPFSHSALIKPVRIMVERFCAEVAEGTWDRPWRSPARDSTWTDSNPPCLILIAPDQAVYAA